jgi:hypothetical protein
MKVYNGTGSHSIQLFLLLAALIVCASLTGCVSSARVSHEATVGQQLQDLDKSYKDGIISKKEYERLKKAIVNKND